MRDGCIGTRLILSDPSAIDWELNMKKGVAFEGRRSIKLVKTFSHSLAVVLHKYSGRSFGLLARARTTRELKRPQLVTWGGGGGGVGDLL